MRRGPNVTPARNQNVERITLDAAALVRAASPEDWPGGFAVVAEHLPRGIIALACGSGRGVAELYRLRPGVRAVLVDVSKVAKDVAAPTAAETAAIECTTLHEAAHCLTTPEDAGAEDVGRLLHTAGDDVLAYPPERIARGHDPRWAMAFWLLVNRAAEYRRTGRAMVEHVAGELALYGYPRPDLERLAVGVEPDEPLAGRLAVGGVWDTLLCDQLPSIEQRANAIVAAGVSCGDTKG